MNHLTNEYTSGFVTGILVCFIFYLLENVVAMLVKESVSDDEDDEVSDEK